MKIQIEKSSWVASSVSNKVGTVLFALSAVMFVFCFSNWYGMFSALKKLDDSMQGLSTSAVKTGLIIFFPFFILHGLLAAGMFMGYNACTAVTKSYGISVLILDIVMTVALGVAVSFILPAVSGALGSAGSFLGNFSGMFDNFKELANSIDKDTIKQFAEASKEISRQGIDAAKENPAVLNEIYSKYLGSSIDPDTVAKAMAALKFIGCWAKVMVFLVLSQVLTVLSSFLIKINSTKKTRLVALILCLFTWGVGGHLLYVGRTGKAVVRIIFTVTVVLMIIPVIFTLLDLVKILTGKFIDKEKQPVIDWV